MVGTCFIYLYIVKYSCRNSYSNCFLKPYSMYHTLKKNKI